MRATRCARAGVGARRRRAEAARDDALGAGRWRSIDAGFNRLTRGDVARDISIGAIRASCVAIVAATATRGGGANRDGLRA
jgi:hypothetical protein